MKKSDLIVVSIDGSYNDKQCDSHIKRSVHDHNPPRCEGKAVCAIRVEHASRNACQECIDKLLPEINLALVTIDYWQ